MDEIWDVAQVADVEKAVVRGAVVAAESAAIHAERDVEILQRDVVDNHVVGALHEGRVNREEWLEALGRETCGEERGVLLGDADIEVFVGMRLGKMHEAGAGRHGSGDRADFVIRLGEFRERLAEEFAVRGRGCGRGLARLGLEFSEAVKFVGLLQRGRVAFAFRGEDVQEHGLVLRFQELESAFEQRDIVPVDGAVVAQAEFLEDDAREQQIFHAGLDLVREVDCELSTDRLDELRGLFVQVRIGRVRGDLVEVARDGAHVFRDGPFVVVEHDDEFFRLPATLFSAS